MENKFTVRVIFIIICLIQFVGNAQNEYEHYLMQQVSASNAAAKCCQDGSFLQASFINKFYKKEMLSEAIEFRHIHQKNGLFCSISHSGFTRFGELTASVGYGRLFGQRFSVAMQAVYLLNHAESYSATHSFTINISAFCKMTDKCALSVEAANPIRMRYGVVGGDLIPMHFDVRFLYAPYHGLKAFAYVRKELPGELDIGMGGIWQAHRHLLLGLTAANTHLQAGIHIPFNKIITAINCQWHFLTGFSPQCNITLRL